MVCGGHALIGHKILHMQSNISQFVLCGRILMTQDQLCRRIWSVHPIICAYTKAPVASTEQFKACKQLIQLCSHHQ